MFKTFSLRLGGIGYLASFKKDQNDVVAEINIINHDDVHCPEDCIFKCSIPDKYIRLFDILNAAYLSNKIVKLSFWAFYRNFEVFEMDTPEYPDRILTFYAELDHVQEIFLNDKIYSVKHLLKKQ